MRAFPIWKASAEFFSLSYFHCIQLASEIRVGRAESRTWSGVYRGSWNNSKFSFLFRYNTKQISYSDVGHNFVIKISRKKREPSLCSWQAITWCSCECGLWPKLTVTQSSPGAEVNTCNSLQSPYHRLPWSHTFPPFILFHT